MSDKEIVGRCCCPVCGEPTQDVKVNKNNNLYLICDNGCRANFSAKDSRRFLPALRRGMQVVTNKNIIISTKNKEITENEQKQVENRTIAGSDGAGRAVGITGRNAGASAGIDTGRRTAGNAGADDRTGAGHATGWLGWLAGDDDSDE